MEGLWYTHFTAGTVHGDGLAVLRNGEILGGDPTHTYTGSYREDGSLLYASVEVSPYEGATTPADLAHPVTFFLEGLVAGKSANVHGHPTNRPDVTISVEMRRGA